MKTLLISFSILISASSFSQEDDMTKYDSLINVALHYYELKDYKTSANAYSQAFQSIGWKSYPRDKYNVACVWSLANQPDSAFYYLNKIVTNIKYNDLNSISNDKDFIPIHKDKRWKQIIKQVKKNKAEIEKDFDHKIVKQLNQIIIDDQQDRGQLGVIEEKYGRNSKQMDSLWDVIRVKDSINLIKVEKIITKNGWLGPKKIGYDGVETMFLVIQHSDIKTQEKYLPMMQEANKKGEFDSGSLALLEDRIANSNGKLQIYGSQVGYDESAKEYYLLPVEDPDNLDKRRATMNLGPISEYLAYFEIKWNLEEYKTKLPYYISLLKAQH